MTCCVHIRGQDFSLAQTWINRRVAHNKQGARAGAPLEMIEELEMTEGGE